jgi:putative phosphoesterase|tara:strand:+ start:2015 stop:2506 length:492 start_codon:yes stop_codon:yes gene_type:complete
MTKILILSDTHSNLDDRILKHIKSVNQVWHAGDIGSLEMIDKIVALKTVIGVHGNIDNHLIKREYPLNQVFTINGKKVVITHIAGYPKRYQPRAIELIKQEKPDLFICGHSHILKIIYDKQFKHLHINPGAIGNKGFHTVQTAIKLTITKSGEFTNLEIIELT